MYVIGAVINTSVPGVNEAIEQRDESKIIGWSENMLDYGAQMLAINCGDRIKTEPEDIEWIFRTIQKHFEVPLCIDSPNPEAHKAGLLVHNDDYGRPMVNSITLEKERIEAIMPLVQKHNCLVTAILHDESGMPQTPEQRVDVMPKMEQVVEEYGVDRGDVYLDNMVFPLSVNSENGNIYLESMRRVKEHYPGYKRVCGLNNISYGLPKEDLLDATFAVACAALGQEAIFIEISGVNGASLKAAKTLLGEDAFCMEYLKAYRKGMLDIYKDEAVKGGQKAGAVKVSNN